LHGRPHRPDKCLVLNDNLDYAPLTIGKISRLILLEKVFA